MRLKAEIISAWEPFFSLKEEWRTLLPLSRSDTIFLTWEWMCSWIETVGKTVRPFVIAVRAPSGRLLGIAPFYVGKLLLLNVVPFRTLRIIGDASSGAEYPAWIAHRDFEKQTMMAIGNLLAEKTECWDCIWMPNMAGWTGAVESVKGVCRGVGFFCHVRPRSFSAFPLPDDMESFFNCFSVKKRQQLRRLCRKLLGRKGKSIERCRTERELPRYLDALFDLHHRRWKQKGDEGAFLRKPPMVDFYQRFAPKALKNGWLRLYAFEDNGDIKAVQIGYDYQGNFHQLQEGFDPEYSSGVGNVLRLKVIEDCINDGMRCYDFLGGFSDHKRRWLAQEKTGYDLFIGASKFRNRLLFAKEIWPTGRFLCMTE